jgi:basic membrane lipoprotein Med (substrate-binding protein (PBP1-ABC) superfamily)
MAAGLRGIGNIHDWTAESPFFLASALADCGVAMEKALAAFRRGEASGRRIGLETSAVRLALAPEVTAELRARLDSLAAAILAGRVAVPGGWVGQEFRPEALS